MSKTFLALAVLAAALPSFALAQAAPSKAQTECSELGWRQWSRDGLLVVQEATTCAYAVTWAGWSPERRYRYAPDAEGWISDYFIHGGHGRVFWNLRTNAVVVRPLSQAVPLDDGQARQLAEWARRTIFPGADLATYRFNSSPCPAGTCGPK